MFAATLVPETAVGGFKESMEFGCSSGEGGVDVSGCGGGDQDLVAAGAGFEDAAFVARAVEACFACLSCQVNFDAGEVGVEAAKDVDDISSDGIGELVVHRDRVVTVDLNLHGLSFVTWVLRRW